MLYYLAGLICTEETFVIKAGVQRMAAALGLMLVTCDTSPRGLNLPGEDNHWDFATGARFYLDATVAPWSAHYRMGSYVASELSSLIAAHFPADPGWCGIFGHSMGGHGALVTALRHPDRYKSVSTFACRSPIPSPFPGARRRSRTIWDPTGAPGTNMIQACCCAAAPCPTPSWWTKATETSSWKSNSTRRPRRLRHQPLARNSFCTANRVTTVPITSSRPSSKITSAGTRSG